MLLDLGPPYLLGLLTSDDQLRQRVEEAVEIIMSQGRFVLEQCYYEIGFIRNLSEYQECACVNL